VWSDLWTNCIISEVRPDGGSGPTYLEPWLLTDWYQRTGPEFYNEALLNPQPIITEITS